MGLVYCCKIKPERAGHGTIAINISTGSSSEYRSNIVSEDGWGRGD
jgi:hypothetical protein